MGSAQWPRIYFTGYQYWNPNTVNNNDYGGDPPYGVNTWDPPNADFNSKYLESQGVQTDQQIPPFLRKNSAYDPPHTKPGQRQMPPGEWGLYGGQQCGFVTDEDPKVAGPFSVPAQKTCTTGYTDLSGNYGKDPKVEPWVGQSLEFDSAKLVDVNPQSFWSSQVFVGAFTLGTAENGFTGAPVARMHSRFISTAKRNYNSKNDLVIAAEFGAIFQTCFDHHSVHFNGNGGPVQQGFKNLIKQGAAGLMLRYSAYSTLYFQGSAFDGMDPGDRYPMLEKMGELYEAYAADPDPKKQPPISRAYSRVAGWIGVWLPDELVSVPGGRFLIPYDQGPAAGKQPIAVTPSNLEPGQYGTPPEDTPDNTDGPQFAPQPLGPATVEVASDEDGNPTRFTLDLGNTFPERDSSGVKADFGTVKLGVAGGEGPVKWVSQDVPYDQDTYEKYGGLVDLPAGEITASDIAKGSFCLQVESGREGATEVVNALWETLATAHTDTRGMYAEQPGPGFSDGDAPSPGPGMPSTHPGCTLKVRYAGVAPGDSPLKPRMKLGWQALDYQLNPYPAGMNSHAAGTLPIEVHYKNPAGQFVPFEGRIDVPDDGSVEVQVVSKGNAIPNLIFLPESEQQGQYSGAPFLPPAGIGSSYYVVIKCLNWDNACAGHFDKWLEGNPPVEAVNQAVWDLVFKSYYYGFPVMDWIGSPQVFHDNRSDILNVTEPATFDQPGYMPVTRTWSAGQRHIMVSYCAYLAKLKADQEAGEAAASFESPQPEGLVEARSVSPTGENLGHG